jgi:hypothetical protein
MKIIHNNGFTNEEIKRGKTVCIANTIISMKTLVENSLKLNIEIENRVKYDDFDDLQCRKNPKFLSQSI